MQGPGDELVDFVADLIDGAQHDVGGCIFKVGKLDRVGECLDQAFLRHLRLAGGRVDNRPAVGAEHVEVDVLVQHRVAEAIDDVGELRRDRRVEMHVNAGGNVNRRRDLAGKFVEHNVLVLRFGGELRGLEQALAVPLVGLDLSCRCDDRAAGVEYRTGQNDARKHPFGRVAGISAVEFVLHQLLDGGE